MNAERCLQILREIKDVSFATVDDKGGDGHEQRISDDKAERKGAQAG